MSLDPPLRDMSSMQYKGCSPKTPEEDCIPTEIDKSCVDNLGPSLREVIEQAWKDKVVSNDWVSGTLVSVFKKGDKTSYQQPTAVCFVDFATTFDSVHREFLWRIMALDGVPPKITVMIKVYYRSITARILFRNNLSQPFGIRSGVRQGCILSSILLNNAIGWILGRTLHKGDVEFAPGYRLTDLGYADDIALLALLSRSAAADRHAWRYGSGHHRGRLDEKLTREFRTLDTDLDGWITVGYEAFLYHMLSCFS
nr:unnamed protein product [Spirometra erinaceieuropaei]